MNNPKNQSALSDKQSAFHSQAALSDYTFGMRMKSLLGEHDMAWLSRETGIATSTLSDIGRGKTPRADKAVAIARALDSSVEFLMHGAVLAPQPGFAPVEVNNADWVVISRHDLRQIDDHGKGEPLDPTPFRKDWLNATLGISYGLWLAAMLADYAPSGLAEGDLVFCQDIQPVDLIDGHLCFFRINGAILTARYSVRPRTGIAQVGDRLGENIVTASEIGTGDDQFVPVARILAKFGVQRI